jgi:hypothetical protein
MNKRKAFPAYLFSQIMTFRTTHLFHFLILSLCIPCFGQEAVLHNDLTSSGLERRHYVTQTIGDEEIKLDGVPDEAAWQNVEWTSSFVEHQPDNGGVPSEQTAFKIVHNDKYLYLAYRAFDSHPDSIVCRMGRRDEFPGDWIELNIDSYHDLRSAFSFTFSVCGVKSDEYVSEDGHNWDENWNPVWDAVSNIDSLGWTAELRIPFSQLRYGNQTEPVWGIQVQRRLFRKEERSSWQHVPITASGWVSQFGELHGLRDLPSNRQIELAPYIVLQTERFEKQAGNPFLDGSKSKILAGIDGKLGVTRDMILDFTINPDFGQVEADPGAVRLDGYEIFFEERRPFFMESRNLFDYRITGSFAGGDYDSDLLFYSRRIGGSPHGYPNLEDNEFADIPTNTSILGAAKFSGKTKKGLSLGILESITKPEHAQIALGDNQRKELVEPLTNYFVGRIIKDFNQGNTILGAMVTSVNRDQGIPSLNRYAISSGLNFEHSWKNKWWVLRMNFIMSRIGGSKESLLASQTGFVHLFQRTDADYIAVDPNRTALTGTGGTIKLGKYSGVKDKNGGIYQFETGVTWRSPGLELNDIGFLLAADEINHFTWAAYNHQNPFWIFRNAQINYNHWARWDFGGRFLFTAFNTNTQFWFNNNWKLGAGITWNPYEVSNTALRGTTALRKPPGYGLNVNVQSDSRKKISYSAFLSNGGAYQKTVSFLNASVGIDFQPFDAFLFSISPGYGKFTRKQDQFVENVSFNNQTRSIVSAVKQQDFSISTRFNYYITPELTIQYYGQPFIFRANYEKFGYVSDPLNAKYDSRFHQFTPEEIKIQDGQATVDENHDGQSDYTFHTPDFNFIQFRSNLVVRWEYVAGSEIYLVWSQDVLPDAFGDLQTPVVRSLFNNVFDEKPHNIFLVKFSYRFLN